MGLQYPASVEIVAKGLCKISAAKTKKIVNVFHYTTGAAGGTRIVPTATQLLALATAFLGLASTGAGPWQKVRKLLAAVAANAGYTQNVATLVDAGIWVRLLDDPTSQPIRATYVAPTDGDGLCEGDAKAPSETLVMKMKTLQRGKGMTGFKRFSPTTENIWTSCQLDQAGVLITGVHPPADDTVATAIAEIQTALTTALSDGANSWKPSIFNSKGSNLTTNPATVLCTQLPAIVAPVTAAMVIQFNEDPGTLRRRKWRAGR